VKHPCLSVFICGYSFGQGYVSHFVGRRNMPRRSEAEPRWLLSGAKLESAAAHRPDGRGTVDASVLDDRRDGAGRRCSGG
jgi:hypothetical protein